MEQTDDVTRLVAQIKELELEVQVLKNQLKESADKLKETLQNLRHETTKRVQAETACEVVAELHKETLVEIVRELK